MITAKRATLATATGLALIALALQPLPAAAYVDDETGGGGTHVNEATAVANDVALIAADQGWSIAATANHMQVQRTLGNLLKRLATDYPQTFAGGVLAEQPGGPSQIRFKGAVPPAAAQLVASAGIPVQLFGGAKYSSAELRNKATNLVTYLRDHGYTDVVAAVMPQGFVDLTIGSGAATPTLPPALGADVRINGIAWSAGIVEHTRGGAWLQDANFNECTSGFTVIHNSTGVTGVTTAAHCSGLDEYNPPNGDPDYSITFQAEHLGFFGDFQWQTSTHIEPDEFYATDTEIRNVSSVASWSSFAVNDSYCVYGRSSNDRECDQIYSLFVVGLSGSTPVGNLIAMDEDNTIGGDSGGTWAFGTEAAGIHRGDKWISSAWRNVWSMADLLPDALGVTVMS